jgi:hypothetical protein
MMKMSLCWKISCEQFSSFWSREKRPRLFSSFLKLILQFTDLNLYGRLIRQLYRYKNTRRVLGPSKSHIYPCGEPSVVRWNLLSTCNLVCLYAQAFSPWDMLDSDFSNDDNGVSSDVVPTKLKISGHLMWNEYKSPRVDPAKSIYCGYLLAHQASLYSDGLTIGLQIRICCNSCNELPVLMSSKASARWACTNYYSQYGWLYITAFNFLQTCLSPAKLANNVSRGEIQVFPQCR